MESVVEYEVDLFDIGNRKVEICRSAKSFRPNRVTTAFIQGLPDSLEGKVVYDIGSGTGVIAIAEALRGAKVVHAVEPADVNYEILLKNCKDLGLEEKIITYNEEYFNPLNNVEKADVITADVSGIPKIFGRALGWYSDRVKTGGENGYEITCELLKRARDYMKSDAILLFPTADDLLDANKILEVAYENFGKENVENALCSEEDARKWYESEGARKIPWRSPDYVWFQLTRDDMGKLDIAYGKEGGFPDTISLCELRKNNKREWDVCKRRGNEILNISEDSKVFWRGRVHKITKRD